MIISESQCRKQNIIKTVTHKLSNYNNCVVLHPLLFLKSSLYFALSCLGGVFIEYKHQHCTERQSVQVEIQL